MKTSSPWISYQAANQIDLVNYLGSLGYHPAKIRLNDYWFLSPFRNENTASFKVHRSKNIWYDHGEGIGGNLIDFGIRYYQCQLPEFMSKLSLQFPFQQLNTTPMTKTSIPQESPIKIIDVSPINSLDLYHYLKSRRIDFQVANTYCQQVVFSLGNKTEKALGFPNNQGGYELRNFSFKGSIAPKSTTIFRQAVPELAVFEGFFDFLSYQTIYKTLSIPKTDHLVLNSTAFFEKSRPVMEDYEKVRLFLDHDGTGEGCTKLGMSWGNKYQDESSLYRGYKDLNEWVRTIGKAQKMSYRPGLK
jgi:hypothetical protein